MAALGPQTQAIEPSPSPNGSPQDATPVEKRIIALSAPGLLIGMLCVVATCVVVCYAELVVGKIQIGFLQLPPVGVGMLVLLLGAQAAARGPGREERRPAAS